MGRAKIELKKIEKSGYRNIAFSKRKNGLVNKAYELSTLCDIEIALVTFSPAGKLFIYDAKKRWEQVLKQYFDLPAPKLGRLRNQELVGRFIDQLILEANDYHQVILSRGKKASDAAQMEVLQSEVRKCTSELEKVEKEISNFLGIPSSLDTRSEAEHEQMLEETLLKVQIRKQILEAIHNIKLPAPENAFYPMDINPSSFMVGNSSYNPERSPLIDPAALVVEVAGNSSYNAYNTPPIDPTALLMDAATSSIYNAFRPPLSNPTSPLMMDVTGYTGFQPFSNPPQALPGVLQLSPTYIDGYNFSFSYIQSNELNMLPYMRQSHQSGQYANFNLPSRMNTTEKGTATEGAPQGEEENSAMGFYTAHSYPGHGNPSQF